MPEILLTDDRGILAPRPEAAGNGKASTPTERPKLNLPPILLTGDRSEPEFPASLQPTLAEVPAAPASLAALPAEAPAVWLAAQDAHVVCAQWSLPPEQITEVAAMSHDGLLHLRIIAETPAPTCVVDQPVPVDASGSFATVPEPRAPYHAELGMRTAEGEWRMIAASPSVCTPPDAPRQDFSYAEASWQTPSIEVSAPEAQVPASTITPTSVTSVTSVVPRVAPAIQSVPRTRPPSRASALRLAALSTEESWSESFASDSLAGRRQQVGLEEALPELEVAPGNPSSEAFVAGNAPTGGEGLAGKREESPSSPLIGPPSAARKFWFKINAEVVLYGSTEPDATVSIGSYPVKLRPDGTFSFRFALPEGEYPLPVVAIAADGRDGRAARVTFRRKTETVGVVGVHPQDPALKPPRPEYAS